MFYINNDFKNFNSIQYNQVNSYYYKGLSCLVNKTLNSSIHAEAWFSSNTLRAKMFNSFSYPKSKSTQVAKRIWVSCVYTIPLALTILAPKKSYEAIEQDVIGLSTDYEFENNCISTYVPSIGQRGRMICVNELSHSSKRIEIGLNHLEKHFSEEMKENQGKIFLCYIYGSTHAFIIERRGNDTFHLFQSYLNQYDFLEFLSDDSKHKIWTREELITSLTTILQECLPEDWKQKTTIYESLFYYKRQTPLKTSFDAQRQTIPFVFIATDVYDLNWRVKEQDLEICTEKTGKYVLSAIKREGVAISITKEMKLLAATIQTFLLSKNSHWFSAFTCIEASEIVHLYKPILNSFEKEEMKKTFSVFIKIILQHCLDSSFMLLSQSFDALDNHDVHFLLQMLPWSNLPSGLFAGKKFNKILWSVISARAAEGELINNPEGIKKAEEIAHYIDNSHLIGSFMLKASPELILAVTPYIRTKFNERYSITQEIQQHLENSTHPNKEKQISAFYQAMGFQNYNSV